MSKRKFEELEYGTKICTEIQHRLTSALEGKEKGKSYGDQETLLGECSSLFIELKEANRNIQLELDRRKSAVGREKERLEDTVRAVSALASLRTFLAHELRRLRAFRYPYPPPPHRSPGDGELPLRGEEEFEAFAPPDLRTDDPALRPLHRLLWELRERSAVAQEREEAAQRCKALSQKGAQHRAALQSLEEHLGGVRRAAELLRLKENLPLPNPFPTAPNLPTPLYLLLHQALALPKDYPNLPTVRVVGKLSDEPPSSPLGKVHPLSVELRWEQWEVLVTFHSVTVGTASLLLARAQGSRWESALLPHLWPGDAGRVLPVPLPEDQDSVSMATEGEWGRPYVWAQRLGGGLALPPPPVVPMGLVTLRHVIDRLRDRLTAWQTLHPLTEALERGALPTPLRTLPGSLHLQQWTAVPPGAEVPSWALGKEEGGWEYQFALRHAEVPETEGVLLLPPDYPFRAPRWALRNPTAPKDFQESLAQLQQTLNDLPAPSEPNLWFTEQLKILLGTIL